MSTELKGTTSLNGGVLLNRYFGGVEDGVCVQVTPKWGECYVQLTKAQALELAVALVEFANDTRAEREE